VDQIRSAKLAVSLGMLNLNHKKGRTPEKYSPMADTKLRPAILIVSDTAARDPSTDRASGVLCETFASEGGDRWEKPVTKIVPDNVLDIQRNIVLWTEGEGYFNVILTTGGTGFATKDNTPEVSGVHDTNWSR
jgi:molybdopterin biosynthesis enzyme MoaB